MLRILVVFTFIVASFVTKQTRRKALLVFPIKGDMDDHRLCPLLAFSVLFLVRYNSPHRVTKVGD